MLRTTTAAGAEPKRPIPKMGPSRGRVTKRRGGHGRRGGRGGGGGSGSSGGGRRRPPKGPSQRASKVAAREREVVDRKTRHAEKCAAGRKRKEDDERAEAARAPLPEGSAARKKQLKKKKRVRRQSFTILTVLGPGDTVPFSQGGPRSTDLAPRANDEAYVPRKQRELMALIAKTKGAKTSAGPGYASTPGAGQTEEDANSGEGNKTEKLETDGAPEKREKAVKFDGMQRGETFDAFKNRLRAETNAAKFAAARAGNHQREKKKLYYEKKRARAERRARRRAGHFSDEEADERDDGGEEDEGYGGGSINLWADMLRERMAENSKSRKPRHREEEAGGGDEDVRFGETVQCPPQFANLPVKRGRGSAPAKRDGVVVSDAAGLLAGGN